MFGKLKSLFTGRKSQESVAGVGGYVPRPPMSAAEVSESFVLPHAGCVWVSDGQVADFMRKGYSFCPHPDGRAVCIRTKGQAGHERQFMDFLLLPPSGKSNVSFEKFLPSD